mmetsp:Transcript_10664/g.23576  ORF Transcript_10664/g.23576 Transcript_10664/m.23576 type:complete len:361 (-) Transcript_10664:88-1170(-)|eukprot:CAMPEP_0172308824 /NCGR_PEP_ID=MMETSP1058-20130122/9307_1 /TAXON_ID=83371 /ORGANISM="Detonula confervacea, Strain CCMP 353" /LENGTH=360 /DNA_ID=CAMNT_0013021333 /DNA_START=343 /DNA_END=1425 /DNA_ORIENTATION=+
MTRASTSSSVVVARLLLPDDANVAGNVHGGTTLKLMEEAGMIAATRLMASSEANKESEGRCVAALVRFDTMIFHKPIFVGEVASCQCEIIFTSKQSILVEVMVTAEDISKGETRVTNTGWLWYVPMTPPTAAEKKNWKIAQVPPIVKPEGEAAIQKYEKAKAKYEKRKNRGEDGASGEFDAKETNSEFDTFKSQYIAPTEGRSPAGSEQVLCQMVLPGDCGKGKVAFGGFVMKLMDNAAGCSAWRHCRTNVVTVAISDMDFVSWVSLGDLCSIRSKVVFASSKSLEIEVVASVASVTSDALNGKDNIVARGLFTFVSIGSDGKVQAVPKLVLESEEDMQNAFFGTQRYEAAKRARIKGSH